MFARTLPVLLIAAAASLFGGGRVHANLVADPSFEAATIGQAGSGESVGDGWSATTAAYVNDNAGYAHGGSQYAELIDFLAGSPYSGGIQQSIATMPGSLYRLDFFADSNAAANSFAVSFGGAAVSGIPTALPDTGAGAASDYREYTALVTALSSLTTLAFNATDNTGNGAWTRIDDVSVTQAVAVAEPAGFTALGVGLLSLTVARRRRLA
jgi:hypothetical protein